MPDHLRKLLMAASPSMGFQRSERGAASIGVTLGGLPCIDSSDSVLPMSYGKTIAQLREVAHVIVPKGAAFEVAIIDQRGADLLPEERQHH